MSAIVLRGVSPVVSVLVLALLGIVSEPTMLRAQPATPQDRYGEQFFAPLEWRLIGPIRGGRSLGSTGSPGRKAEYYFGAVGGGLWKTVDGGTTWEPVTDGQLRSSSVGAVAVAETNPDVVYIGMGEVALRGNIMQGDGVYKSVDAGATWTHMGLAETQVISRIRVHPTDPDVVYVAAFGHVAGANEERGVFRSRDGGATWEKVLYRDDKTGAVDLVIDRNDPDVLYAALWEAYRVSYQMSSGGPGSGLFKSVDGGDTWIELTRNPGMPDGVIGKVGVAVSPADADRVWAIVENDDGGVFRSDDGGWTWTRINDERRLRQRAFYYSRIYADTRDRDTLYVLNTGFYKSVDGGETYETISVPHGDNHDLWIDPNDPNRMINSNDGGGNVSINGGQTWTAQDYPTAQLYHVTTTADFPYHVCGAQQDNSTACVPSRGWASLRTPRRPLGEWLYSAGGGESGYIAPHPTNPDLFYAGSQGALLTRYDRSNGQIRDIQVYPRFFSGEPSSALPERWQWTFPIVFSPHDPNVLYTSSQHLWKTTNDGQTWERISPDLTLADPDTLGHSGGPITGDMNGPEIFGTIFAVAPSEHDENTIWTGSDDGLVYVTRDGGRDWDNVTPADLAPRSRVSIIDASHHDPAAAYVAVKRYLLDDRAPYIYRTHDYGRTWTKIVDGIREDDYVHVVREDPVQPGLLYAGTEHGVWISFDDGDRWQSLSLNLPDLQVADMVVEAHDLVIGSHGRSMWVLDDIDALRQLTPEVADSPAHLFQPRDAYRGVYDVVIDYYLKDEAEEVTIEILEADGDVLGTYVATADDDADGADPAASPFRYQPPAPPNRQAGLNRFTWDARHPGATTFEGMILWSGQAVRGPLAVPGGYQARLTANGVTQTTSFELRINPNLVGVTVADLQEQFDLAVQIRDRTSDANDAVAHIRELKAQIDDRAERAGEPGISDAAAALKQRLSAIEEELYQVRNRSNQDPLNFPIKLNNRLASLRRSVENGEARPTDAAHTVFRELSDELAAQLSALDDVLTRHLAAFNERLAARRIEPVPGR